MLSIIKPFKINSSKGDLLVKELKPKDLKATTQIHNLAKFFINNFIESSIDPKWKESKKPSNKEDYKTKIEQYELFINNILKNDSNNSTILVAKDAKKHIKAGIITSAFYEHEGIEDPKTLHIRAIAVDKEYRKNNIGKFLVNKTIEKDKRTFTDAFLTAYNALIPFYKKLGFEELDITNPKIKALSDKIKEGRPDVPQYVTLMSKPLDNNCSRWWSRLFEKI